MKKIRTFKSLMKRIETKSKKFMFIFTITNTDLIENNIREFEQRELVNERHFKYLSYCVDKDKNLVIVFGLYNKLQSNVNALIHQDLFTNLEFIDCKKVSSNKIKIKLRNNYTENKIVDNV